MALPAPQFIDALVGTLEDPANQSARLATAMRDAADTYSEAETDALLADKADNADLSAKAGLDSPTFTGTPAVPTASPGTNTTQAASTAFVTAAVAASTGGDVTGPAGATAGNFPALDATGKILSDSGKKPADFATSTQGGKADTAVQPARTVGTGTGLTGGGDLSTDRTIALTAGSVASLAKADSAAQLNAPQAWTETQRGTIVLIAPAATMTLNLNDGQEFRMSAGLNQNATVQLSNADSHVGAKFSFTGYNNGTGGFTLSYGTGLISIGGASPTAIPTGANAKWRIDGQIVAAGEYQFTARGVGV